MADRPAFVATAGAVLLASLALAGCQRADGRDPSGTGGDARRGERLLSHYQCGSCHVIPGVRSADGRIGPPLEDFGQRSYIAGEVPNGPDALVRWLQDPQQVVPGTRMPDMGVTEADARDMAAYLMERR